MIAKSLKIGIVLAVTAIFFTGTAMAGGRHREDRQRHRVHGYHKEYRGKHLHHYRNPHGKRHHRNDRHYAHGENGKRKHRAKHHYRPEQRTRHDGNRNRSNKRHPLAPKIAFLGPIPVPLPPPPHAVLGLGR